MINTATDKVYLATESIDMRKSIDGLAAIVQESFKLDPFSNNLFVFCNRNRNKIKILHWEHNGFWLHYRRLEKGLFQWPKDNNTTIRLSNRELQWLLNGLSIYQKQAHKKVDASLVI
jgi:transposase